MSGPVALNEESGVRTVEGFELLFYTESAYDEDGKITEDLNGRGVTTRSTYDERDQLTEQTMSKGNESETTSTTYNDAGSPLTETAADGKVTTYEYDIEGNVLSTTVSKDGHSLRTEASEPGQAENGKRLDISFDAKARPISRYTDSLGDLIKETVGTKTTVNTYDADGHLLNSTLTDTAYPNQSKVTTYEYTGNLNTRKTYAPDHYVDYAYDQETGHLLSETVTKGDWSHTTTYTYDAATGKVLTTTRNGDTTSYTYTPTGSLESVTYETGDVVSYDYDTEGRVVLIRHNNDVPLQRHEYNAEGFLAKVWGYDSFGEEYLSKSYGYDWKGTLINKTYYDQSGNANEQYDLEYEYDKIVSETKTQLAIYSGSPIVSETAYEYDWLDRLVSETVDGAVTEYTYDVVGNRLSMTDSDNDVYAYTYNDADQLLTAKKNNVVSASYEYDMAGNQTSDGGSVDYVFDAANQLEKVMEGASVTAEYTYDATGQRLSKTVDNQTTEYYYDGIDLLYIKENHQLNDVFLRGLGGDIILGIRDNTGYAYRTDVRGSITNILDDWGNVVQRTAYDAYGNATVDYDAFESNLGYTGAVLDQETGLYYLSARYYDPETSRFISEDPARDGQSWYMYCNGDPVNHIDPSGLVPINYPTVRQGSSGPCVKLLQRFLNDRISKLGVAKLALDGIFGPKTYAATRKYQLKTARKLTVDGIVGPKTWEAIMGEFNCLAYARGTTARKMTDLPRALTSITNKKNLPSRSTLLRDKQYLIAFRMVHSDTNAGLTGFHVWKKNPETGVWWDKPGDYGIRTLGYATPEVKKQTGWLGSKYYPWYNGQLYYYIVKNVKFWSM